MKTSVVVIGAVVIALAAFALGYALRGAGRDHTDTHAAPAAAQPVEPQVWTCSMHPQIRQPKPGLCPICGMQLIPVVTRQETGGLRELVTSEAAMRLMEIETAPVERRFADAQIRLVGKIEYDETRLAQITAWVGGRIDRLFVNYTGVAVRKGDHMVELYSPDLLAAQEELIQAAKAVRDLAPETRGLLKAAAEATLTATREKLRLWGLTAEQIAGIEARGKGSDHVTIFAPIGGIVVMKDAFEGMYVTTGSRIYTIADLEHLWVKLDAYESDLTWLRYGQKVTFSTEAYPGETFTGTIAFIDPVLNAMTRTVKVRVNVANPDGRLKPEMFVRAVVRPQVAAGGRVMDAALAGKWICPMHPEVVKNAAGECDICGMPLARAESLGYMAVDEGDAAKPLIIPASAVLVTGTRAVVYVKDPAAKKPTFNGREVLLGPRAGDYYLVRNGLREGELVVTRGAFKLDSSIQIQARPSMMSPEGGAAPAAHEHGPTGTPRAGAPGAPGETLPAAVAARLRDVDAACRLLAEVVRKDDLAQTRAAFRAFGQAVKSVDASGLTGRALAQWQELAMRFGNDAVEGAEAKTVAEARRLAGNMAPRVQQLREHFRLGAPVAVSRPALTVPATFQAQVAAVWQAYQAVHAGLAADDRAKAADAAAQVRKAVEAADRGLLDGPARDAWTADSADVGLALDQMARAGDIEAQRRAFALLSEALRGALRRFGGAAVGRVYDLHCPMAFNNRGANWLQKDTAVRNPYFGAAMIGCGDVVETIGGEAAPPASGGHAHD